MQRVDFVIPNVPEKVEKLDAAGNVVVDSKGEPVLVAVPPFRGKVLFLPNRVVVAPENGPREAAIEIRCEKGELIAANAPSLEDEEKAAAEEPPISAAPAPEPVVPAPAGGAATE